MSSMSGSARTRSTDVVVLTPTLRESIGMKTKVSIGRLGPEFVEPEVIDDLIGIYPEGAQTMRNSKEFEAR